MERMCFTLTLKAGREAEYEQRHADLWPEMHHALTRAGFTNYTLFRVHCTVVGYAECVPDVATVNARMQDEPVTERWNASFVDIIEPTAEGALTVLLAPVWHLE